MIKYKEFIKDISVWDEIDRRRGTVMHLLLTDGAMDNVHKFKSESSFC